MSDTHDFNSESPSGAGSFKARSRFFDDLAGVAGGAFSAMAGLRDEAASVLRGRIDDAVRRLDLVRREEMEAALEMAANARAGQEAAELRIAALEARIAALELRPDAKADLAAAPVRP